MLFIYFPQAFYLIKYIFKAKTDICFCVRSLKDDAIDSNNLSCVECGF